MGYYATGYGHIWVEKIHYDAYGFEDVFQDLREQYGWEYELSNEEGADYLLLFSKNSKWHYEDEEKVLVDFLSNPKVFSDSFIELVGEDSDHWKYTKEKAGVMFWEGRIVYEGPVPLHLSHDK